MWIQFQQDCRGLLWKYNSVIQTSRITGHQEVQWLQGSSCKTLRFGADERERESQCTVSGPVHTVPVQRNMARSPF